MRLIDADVAIEELTDRSHRAAKRVGTDSPFWEGLVIARRIVNNLPTVQPETQWIPVSERLPEESEYYIITANDGVGHRTTFAKFQKKAKSWNLTGARSYWRVIAWMPLPEPYQKGATT